MNEFKNRIQQLDVIFIAEMWVCGASGGTLGLGGVQ